MKTYEEINKKIKNKECVVVTAEEIIQIVKEKGIKKASEEVDVVTTGTFGPMCSSGAFINIGHAEPPIKIQKATLNQIPAYCGIAAVDIFIGATELDKKNNIKYGGAHVIEDLVNGKQIHIKAKGYPTDCYPRKTIDTYISLKTVNQAYMFNPRNVYQNYAVAINSSNKDIYTYMGKLLKKYGNVRYATCGQLSPLLNDPYFKTIGIGTRILLAGAQGYISWEGTQFKTDVTRSKNGIPKTPAGCLGVIGDLKQMSPEFIKAVTLKKYGVSMAIGIGVPIPILNEEILKHASICDKDIYATIFDYSVPSRDRPSLGEVNYEELKSGIITINEKTMPTQTFSNIKKARKIANILKKQIKQGKFLLQKPIQQFPQHQICKPLNGDEQN